MEPRVVQETDRREQVLLRAFLSVGPFEPYCKLVACRQKIQAAGFRDFCDGGLDRGIMLGTMYRFRRSRRPV